MENVVHINNDFGWFIGSFNNNLAHKHFALQVSIPIDGSITIHSDDKIIKSQSAVLIKPNVEHCLVSDSKHFLLLLNPASTFGHYWNALSTKDISEVNAEPISRISEILKKSHASEIADEINKVIAQYDCFCEDSLHDGDERIDRALVFLSENIDRIIPLNKIAQFCHLSPSRFLHLFKEQTGITYRRAQLWSKLVSSLPLLQNLSLTEAAQEVGFSDSAHFSRTFRENFGFSPREFLKISQFIQV